MKRRTYKIPYSKYAPTLKPDFSVQSAILKRVQTESLVEWGLKKEEMTIPEYAEPKLSLGAGVYNFGLSIKRSLVSALP